MDDETLRALAQKLVVASPFVMMRYITLPDNTTLDMETKLAFAKTLKRQDYAEMFSGIKQNIDTDLEHDRNHTLGVNVYGLTRKHSITRTIRKN